MRRLTSLEVLFILISLVLLQPDVSNAAQPTRKLSISKSKFFHSAGGSGSDSESDSESETEIESDSEFEADSDSDQECSLLAGYPLPSSARRSIEDIFAVTHLIEPLTSVVIKSCCSSVHISQTSPNQETLDAIHYSGGTERFSGNREGRSFFREPVQVEYTPPAQLGSSSISNDFEFSLPKTDTLAYVYDVFKRERIQKQLFEYLRKHFAANDSNFSLLNPNIKFLGYGADSAVFHMNEVLSTETQAFLLQDPAVKAHLTDLFLAMENSQPNAASEKELRAAYIAAYPSDPYHLQPIAVKVKLSDGSRKSTKHAAQVLRNEVSFTPVVAQLAKHFSYTDLHGIRQELIEVAPIIDHESNWRHGITSQPYIDGPTANEIWDLVWQHHDLVKNGKSTDLDKSQKIENQIHNDYHFDSIQDAANKLLALEQFYKTIHEPSRKFQDKNGLNPSEDGGRQEERVIVDYHEAANTIWDFKSKKMVIFDL